MSQATSPTQSQTQQTTCSRIHRVCDRMGRKWVAVTAPVQETLGGLVGSVGYILGCCINRVAKFIKTYWVELVTYLFAWGIIVTCAGFIHGFQALALPLTIGISCGVAFGALVGIATVKIFDPNNLCYGRNSAWGLVNSLIKRLDENGTRQFLLPLAVTVILATAIVFPYAVGAGIGIFLGNQLAIKAGYPTDPLLERPREMRRDIEQIRRQITNYQRLPANSQPPPQLAQEIDTVKREFFALREAIIDRWPSAIDLRHKLVFLQQEIDDLQYRKQCMLQPPAAPES